MPITRSQWETAGAGDEFTEFSDHTTSANGRIRTAQSRISDIANSIKNIPRTAPKIKIELDLEKTDIGLKIILKGNLELNKLVLHFMASGSTRRGNHPHLSKALQFNEYYDNYQNRLIVSGIPNLSFLLKESSQKSMVLNNVFTNDEIKEYVSLFNRYVRELKEFEYGTS